jgi:hypothetical protein
MALDRILSFILRLAELAFAAVVAGINGQYLHDTQGADSWSQARFIYTEVVAGISIFLALVWLLPFSGSFIHWPVDLLISVCWFVAFGLIVNLIGNSCGYVFNWDNVAPAGDACGKWKAVIAFCFLSAICWLVSALIGIFWVREHTHTAHSSAPIGHRRRWYRRSRV